MTQPATQTPARAGMPTGLVTFVFTDVEGSTKLVQTLGDRFRDLLDIHGRLVREAIAAEGGYEVSTAGDGFFIAFADASSAIAACVRIQQSLAIQRWPGEATVRVRIGVHTGETWVSGGDYLGLAVHEAARVSAAGHGGQVLVSETTRALATALPEGADLLDLGTHMLKDLGRPLRLYQLMHPALPAAFPPPRTLSARETNLPRPRTAFFPPRREMEALTKLLVEPCAITLTGPGGCGKTRLAIEVGREVLEDFDAVWIAELRPVATPEEVPAAIADAMAPARDRVGGERGDPLERAIERIGDRSVVLIVDNCEHVVAACADAIDTLMGACHRLRVIATSRDLLGIDGEIARRVPSLSVPSASDDDAEEAPAVALFVERARRVDPAFSLDEASLPHVVAICRRLDGIPLAIELAAAKVRHTNVASIAAGLDDVFGLLGGVQHRALGRQQTLDAVIGWSYDLLDERQGRVLRRLSVFEGSFSLQLAASVVDDARVSEIVFTLVDRSLVERIGDGRYRLLETIRQYAHERLAEAGEVEEVRARHVAAYLALAEQIRPRFETQEMFDALDDLEPEYANVAAAIERAARAGRAQEAMRLGVAVQEFLSFTGRYGELVSLLQTALDAAGDDHPLLRARVQTAIGMGALAATDPGGGGAAKAAVETFERLGATDDPEYGWALVADAAAPITEGQVTGVAEKLDGVIELARARGDARLEGAALGFRAFGVLGAGNLDGARSDVARALETIRRDGHQLWLGVELFWSGMLSMHAHDYEAARTFYSEGLTIFRRLRYKVWVQWELDHVAHACLYLGDLQAARAFAEEGVAVSRQGNIVGKGNYFSLLGTLAWVEQTDGRYESAERYISEALTYVTVALKVAHEAMPHHRVALLGQLARAHIGMERLADAGGTLLEAIDLVAGLEPVALPSGGTQPPPIAGVLDAAATLLVATGNPLHAVTLSAVAAGRRGREESPLPAFRERAWRDHVEALQRALGDEEFARVWAEGSAMSPTEALELARGLIGPPSETA